MKKAPVYVGSFEFDPQVDFSQFLEEARQHARQMNLQNNSLQQEEIEKRKTTEDKKGKKSWKNALFKWWNSDNKTSESDGNLLNYTKRTGHEMPYMCLDQLNDSNAVKDYGPIYLVTLVFMTKNLLFF